MAEARPSVSREASAIDGGRRTAASYAGLGSTGREIDLSARSQLVPGAGLCVSTIPTLVDRTLLTRPTEQCASTIRDWAALSVMPTTLGTTH